MSGVQRNVVAVVVTYGDRRTLAARTCEALLAEGVDRLIVVANGCIPEVVHELRSSTSLEVLPLSQNTGSAGGYYAGLVAALRTQHEFIWLMDDDNLPGRGCLQKLVAAIEPRCSAAMPMRSEPIFQRSLSGIQLPGPGSFMYFDLGEWIGNVVRIRRSGPVKELAYAPYGGLLVRAEAVRRAGLPDFMRVLYEDDSDFTERLTKCSGAIQFVPSAHVSDMDGKWSERRSVLSADSPIRQYYAVRNRVRFDADRARSSGRSCIARLAVNAVIYTGLSVLRDLGVLRWSSLKRFVWAARDGWGGCDGIAPTSRVPNDLGLAVISDVLQDRGGQDSGRAHCE